MSDGTTEVSSGLVNSADPGKLWTVPGTDGFWTWEAMIAAGINPATATDATAGNSGSGKGNDGSGAYGSGDGEDGSSHNPLAYIFHSAGKAQAQTGGTSNVGLNPWGYNLPFKVPDFLSKYWKDFLIASALLGGSVLLIQLNKGNRR